MATLTPPYALQTAPANGNTSRAAFKESAARARSSLVIRNVVVSGKRTSIRLEPEMWKSLHEICRRERCTPHDIATMVAAEKGIGSLTAAMRVFIMLYYFEAATEDGHNTVNHGSGRVLQPLYKHLSQVDGKNARL